MKVYRNFKVLVDLDDTLTNLLQAWVDYLNRKHGLKVDYKKIDEWDITLFFPTLSTKEVFEPLYTDSFWASVYPKKKSIEYLRLLYEEGFDIYVCTNSNYVTLKSKLEHTLFRYFPFIDEKHIIITANKTMVKADVLVDDYIENLRYGSYKRILFDACHNKKYHNIGYDIRVKDWKQCYRAIHKLYEEKLSGGNK